MPVVLRKLNSTIIISFVALFSATAESGWETSVFSLQEAFREVSSNVLPVVVEINVVDVIEQEYPAGNPFGFLFGWPFDDSPESEKPDTREFRQEGLGSGVIVDKRGDQVFVLTNNHVVGEADEISITLYDKRTYEGTLVGKDPLRDLALISFETSDDVPLAVLGNSDDLQVGDWVLAIGNPYGFESTVTAGIVSAKGRTQSPDGQSLNNYIQTDASINQGNSGGALVNLHGEVVGINSWIASQNGGSVGLGFSIPINNAVPAIGDFISKGSVEYGWLGVHMSDLSQSLRDELKIEQNKGAFIFNVYSNSPAMLSHLSPGDLIISIDDQDIQSSMDLTRFIANREPGEVIEVFYIRDNQVFHTEVELTIRTMEEGSQKESLWPGFTVAPLEREMRERLDLPRNSGNIIIGMVDPESKAGALGLETGDVIKEMNGRSVKDISDFYVRLRDVNRIDLTIVRRGYELEYRLSL